MNYKACISQGIWGSSDSTDLAHAAVSWGIFSFPAAPSAPRVWVLVGAAWKQIAKVFTLVAGAWKEVTAGNLKILVSGIWKNT